MCMEYDLDALDGIDLHGDVDMELDSDDTDEEDEDEEDGPEEDADEVENAYEDDGKEP
jgi:hypothetical protein